MKKYFKFIVAAIVLLIFIGTFVFLWVKSRPQPVAYEEFTPTVQDIRKTTVITGKIEPRNEVNVKPKISGIITDIYKEAGQMVAAGEIIAVAGCARILIKAENGSFRVIFTVAGSTTWVLAMVL